MMLMLRWRLQLQGNRSEECDGMIIFHEKVCLYLLDGPVPEGRFKVLLRR